MQSGAVFDREHFAHMTGGDASLQQEILGIFRSQSEIWKRLLIPDAPTPVWRDAAHTVKGSARGLGLWRLGELCEQVETLGRAGAVEGAQLSAALAMARAGLDEALAALEAGDAAVESVRAA